MPPVLSRAARADISWSYAMLSSADLSCISRLRSLSTDSLFAHTLTLSCSFLNPSWLDVRVKYAEQRTAKSIRVLSENMSYLNPRNIFTTGRIICMCRSRQKSRPVYDTYTRMVNGTLVFHL